MFHAMDKMNEMTGYRTEGSIRADASLALEKLRKAWLLGPPCDTVEISELHTNSSVCESPPPTKFIQGIVEYDNPSAYMVLASLTECTVGALSEIQETFDKVESESNLLGQLQAAAGKQGLVDLVKMEDRPASEIDSLTLAGLEEKLSLEEQFRLFHRLVRDLKANEAMETEALSQCQEVEKTVDTMTLEAGKEIDKCRITESNGFDGAHQIFSHLVPQYFRPQPQYFR